MRSIRLIFDCVIIVRLSLAFSQTSDCLNLNFENGDLSNWTVSGNVKIVQLHQKDPYGDFPLALSGQYAIKLGNKDSTASIPPYHSSVSRTFTITNSNKYFIYGFAIVLLGYPHQTAEAAYVKLKVTDASGNDIPCTSYTVFAQSSAGNGFYQSDEPMEENLGGECCYPIYYKPWELNALDLSNYLGQTLTFSLISEWCVFDVDWGYAYVDAYCSGDLLTEYYNCTDSNIYLKAIDGLSPYSWSGPGIVNGLGTSQVQINQPGTYSLFISNPNSGCPPLSIDYEATFDLLPEFPQANFQSDTLICFGDTLEFNNTSASNSNINYSAWSFGDGDSSFAYKPNHLFENAGTYDVVLNIGNEYGCFDSVAHTISVISKPEVDLGPNLLICQGSTLELIPQYYTPNSTFLWSNGATTNSTSISEPQEIILSVLNSCWNSDTLIVEPSPSFFGIVPNVFTPNDDDVNDTFFILNKNVVEYQLVILNRWEQIVFETSDSSKSWDGRFNGQDVLDGVYFYKLKYRLDCHSNLTNEHGFVTVAR